MLTATDIEATAEVYLKAAEGDPERALRVAVADLLDVRDEAELRKLALDQWVSRGYVQGRASERLSRIRASSRHT